MKCVLTSLAAGVAALAITTAASAGATYTEVIDLGSVTLSGGQSQTLNYNGDPGNTDGVIGFMISFDFADSIDTFAYASDLMISFDGWDYTVGGYDNLTNNYDFQGFGSDEPGFYSHDASDAWVNTPMLKDVLISFTLTNDFSFNEPTTWNNIQITLVKVPGPGAVALLGVAGLIGRSRRRR